MATENNDLPVRLYQKQFIGLMQTVFGAQSTFTPTFGALQALDAVQNNAIAFSVKANDVPVAVGTAIRFARAPVARERLQQRAFGFAPERVFQQLHGIPE